MYTYVLRVSSHPLSVWQLIKCGYYSRAAVSLSTLEVRPLFEGGYYSGCGYDSSKYGNHMIVLNILQGPVTVFLQTILASREDMVPS